MTFLMLFREPTAIQVSLPKLDLAFSLLAPTINDGKTGGDYFPKKKIKRSFVPHPVNVRIPSTELHLYPQTPTARITQNRFVKMDSLELKLNPFPSTLSILYDEVRNIKEVEEEIAILMAMAEL